jgi:protein-S-isoprenylcysteine O-methyltransferase Ste14
MFPVLIIMYSRLAQREEQEVKAEFGETYIEYMKTTPMFIPSMKKKTFQGAS